MQNLAYFVRHHEKALANALQLQNQRTKYPQQQSASSASSNASVATTSITLSEAVTRSFLPFTSPSIKAAKLTLTPHHLFYLLSKFEDLGVDIGPMNVRLENLQHNAAPSNYVSFLGHAPKTRGKQSDADSLKSVSSVRSVMSNMSSLWSNLTLSNTVAKEEKQMAQYREDIRYLYSCFTKIPALKLSLDHRMRLVSGFEEFPFDTAVPLFVFKNLSSLEICDLDFRRFFGWDRLAEQIRSLTVRRGNVDDPIDILQLIVMDDMERRRRRSYKNNVPTTPSTPGAPWPSNSPRMRQIELARTRSAPNGAGLSERRGSKGSPQGTMLDRTGLAEDKPPCTPPQRPGSNSLSRQDSYSRYFRKSSAKYRRSSGSSSSETYERTPRHSSTDLLAMITLPSSKWRFLRHLSLPENGLTSLTAASLAPVASTLHSLDLSGNLFSEVPDVLALLVELRALNLSNCMIDSLHSLMRYPLPAITTLNLRANRLISLSGVEKLYSLERVDLRDNKLRDPTELARLTAFPDIRDVYVGGNPFGKTHRDYRVIIFNLFRKIPGRIQDISIDNHGPSSSEKKQLVDRAPEATAVSVVKPIPVEETEPAVPGAAAIEEELQALVMQEDDSLGKRRGHRRTTSDMGPETMRRKKKAPRRRIVELSQAASPSKTTVSPTVLELSSERPRTPTDAHRPLTPERTPYHTAPTTQVQQRTAPTRPTLDTAFHSPTPASKSKDSAADEYPSKRAPEDGDVPEHYRQKVETLKNSLGSNWLSALNEDKSANQHTIEQTFDASAHHSSTLGPEGASKGNSVSVGGRILG